MILFHGFTSFSMCRSPIEDNILSITACLLGILSFTERWGWEMKKFLWEHIKGYWISQRQLYADPICHFRNEKGSGAEMPPAIVSGMVTRDTLLSYWPIFSPSLATVPEGFANVNSVQFPSPFLKWRIDHLSTFSKLPLHTFELQRWQQHDGNNLELVHALPPPPTLLKTKKKTPPLNAVAWHICLSNTALYLMQLSSIFVAQMKQDPSKKARGTLIDRD